MQLSALLRRSKSKRKAPAGGSGSSGSGVIVASDDADARELLSRVITQAGHEVEQVGGSTDALDALSDRPRLALLALFAESRAAGLVRDVRAVEDPAVAEVPVLVVTDDDTAAKAASVAGADGTLTRPFHADELTGELDAVLARSPEERAESRAAARDAED
jgi:DNA-binding response OmpR family regulator